MWGFTPKIFSRIILIFLRSSNLYLSFVLRYLALYRLAKKCGEKVIIFPGVYLKNIENLELGTNITIHEMTYIDAYGGVKIGNDVAISHGVSIVSFDHDFEFDKSNFKNCPPLNGKIVIQNNVWIGAGARVLRNVTISDNCIIGASSLVNRSCDKNSLVAGVPAKLIKKIK